MNPEGQSTKDEKRIEEYRMKIAGLLPPPLP
jgi:hypothetical protein